jgi:squalene-hopene/tetraprenyl-beta-curcumene cyclase
MRLNTVVSIIVTGALAIAAPVVVAQTRGVPIAPEVRSALMQSLERGAAYLMQQQRPDGTWEDNPGIAALAATAILRQTGKTPAEQYPRVSKTLDYLRGLQKPDGGIYIRDLPHYITSVSAMALVAADRPEYRTVVEKARAFLVEQVIDEGEGYTPKDKFYGGVGYGSDLRPDLANVEYALRALKETALPGDHPAWEKAIQFLQRTQNHSETNDQPGIGNDGGFMYYPGFSYGQGGGTQSYGSMTYAGLLSYAYSNVKRDDQRVQAAFKWIRDHYTVDENPNMGKTTLYYYYLVFAKALSAYGESFIADAQGRRHNWRDDLGRKLVQLQHREGFWVNEDPQYWQDNKVLVTAFTMMAIEYTLQEPESRGTN